MTTKDYIIIARVLNATTNGPDTPEPVRLNIVAAFANELAADNPRFNRKRFLAACEA